MIIVRVAAVIRRRGRSDLGKKGRRRKVGIALDGRGDVSALPDDYGRTDRRENSRRSAIKLTYLLKKETTDGQRVEA